MKKRAIKKLSLNKKTIAALKPEITGQIRAGGDWDPKDDTITCATYCVTDCGTCYTNCSVCPGGC